MAKREVNNLLSFGSSHGLTLKDHILMNCNLQTITTHLPADGKKLLSSGRYKLVICGLWPEMSVRKREKTEKRRKLILDSLGQVLLLQIEGETRGESSPRCGRVDLEEGQKVSIGCLLDQVRLRRCGEPTDLTKGTR